MQLQLHGGLRVDREGRTAGELTGESRACTPPVGSATAFVSFADNLRVDLPGFLFALIVNCVLTHVAGVDWGAALYP